MQCHERTALLRKKAHKTVTSSHNKPNRLNPNILGLQPLMQLLQSQINTLW